MWKGEREEEVDSTCTVQLAHKRKKDTHSIILSMQYSIKEVNKGEIRAERREGECTVQQPAQHKDAEEVVKEKNQQHGCLL